MGDEPLMPGPAPPAPKSLSEALSALQAHLPRVAKTADAQYGKYADLTMVSEALLPVLSSLGLSFTARPTKHPDFGFVLTYDLHHISGDSLGGYYPLPDSGSPQQIGSAITYARRYALCAVTGLAPGGDDDDAQAAEQHADRSNNPADDIWAGALPPEAKPGSSNGKQHQQLGMLYQRLGITERDTRLVEMTDRVGREITSAKDLSYAEAEAAIKELRGLAAKMSKEQANA